MLKFLENPFLEQEIATLAVIFLYLVFRFSSNKLVRKYANLNEILEHRTNLVIKYINLLLGVLAFISDTDFLMCSSIVLILIFFLPILLKNKQNI